jgi:hypothetical protein
MYPGESVPKEKVDSIKIIAIFLLYFRLVPSPVGKSGVTGPKGIQ